MTQFAKVISIVHVHVKMAFYFLLLILLTLLMTSISAVPPQHLCRQIDACSCKYLDDGTILNLRSLSGSKDSPFFHDVLSPDGLLYSYSPCGSFTEVDCKDAAVCLKDNTGATRLIGSAVQPQFTYDEITTYTVIGYTAGDIGETHTFVYLVCDSSDNPSPPKLFPNGTQDTGFYIMTVYSVCACGGGCDANGPIKKSKPSANAGLIAEIVMIGIACVIVLYFVIGSVIMKFAFKKTGKEIVPNSAFWCNLPKHTGNCCTWLFEKCFRADRYSNMK